MLRSAAHVEFRRERGRVVIEAARFLQFDDPSAAREV
jgi:hypothetical protein